MVQEIPVETAGGEAEGMDRVSSEPVDQRIAQASRLELKKVSTSRGLSENLVRLAVQKHLPAINRCVQKMLRTQARFGEKIVAILEIDANGRVKGVGADRDEVKKSPLFECVAQEMQKAHFSRPSTKGAVVTLVFVVR
jgi:hypothetical protein